MKNSLISHKSNIIVSCSIENDKKVVNIFETFVKSSPKKIPLRQVRTEDKKNYKFYKIQKKCLCDSSDMSKRRKYKEKNSIVFNMGTTYHAIL